MLNQYQLPVEIQQLVQRCHGNHKSLVLVTGVFDLLHQEHLHFLQEAKAVGDCLLVGIETDMRVKQLKGVARPVETQAIRIKKVQATNLADGVFLLPEQFTHSQDHLSLIKLIRPNLLAVSEHTPNLLQKQNIMEQVGGKVAIVCAHNPKISTTQIINSTQK